MRPETENTTFTPAAASPKASATVAATVAVPPISVRAEAEPAGFRRMVPLVLLTIGAS